MRRFSQKTWYCIAAAWLAVSLTMYWACGVDDASADLKRPVAEAPQQVVRRHQDLVAFTTETQYLTNARPRSSRREQNFPKQLESPPVEFDRGVVRLPDRMSEADSDLEIKPAGFSQFAPLTEEDAPKRPTIWFRGRIELVQ